MAWLINNTVGASGYSVGYFDLSTNQFKEMYVSLSLQEAEAKVHYLNGGDLPNEQIDIEDFEPEQPKMLRGFGR